MANQFLPLNLPFELNEIIFNKLSEKDLLNATLVSHIWKQFIDVNFSKQLLLTIKGGDTDLSDIFNSKRKYHRLKLVKLSEKEMLKILKFFSKTIVELVFEDCRIDTESDMIFDHLKELTLIDCSTTVIKLFAIDSCVNLKILNIFHPHGRPFRNDIVNFLKNNTSLEKINFNMNETCNIFNKDISSCGLKMKLKTVFLSFKSNYELQSTTLANIEKFLQSQGQTLETISLINSANFCLLHKIWNYLKVAKKLFVFSSDPFFDYDTSTLDMLEVNKNLIELELHALGPFTLELKDVTPFLMAAVNLKSLGIWTMRKDIIEFIAYNHVNLRYISCATMEDDCEQYYSDLKSKNGINDKLHLHQYL